MVKFHMSNFKCHTWPTFAEIISSDLRQRLSMLDVIYRTTTESVDSVRLILWSCNVDFFSMDGMDSGGIGCSGLRWDGSRNLTKEGGRACKKTCERCGWAISCPEFFVSCNCSIRGLPGSMSLSPSGPAWFDILGCSTVRFVVVTFLMMMCAIRCRFSS